MYPLAVCPAPRILAGPDDRSAPFADVAWRVRLVVVRVGPVLILIAQSAVFLYRDAQVFLHPVLNFQPSEIGWGSHRVPPASAMAGNYPALILQSPTLPTGGVPHWPGSPLAGVPEPAGQDPERAWRRAMQPGW
jgi:hypothetical protein